MPNSKTCPPDLLLCGGITDLLKKLRGRRGKRIFFLCRYDAMNARDAIDPMNAIDARNAIIAILQA